MEIAAAAGLELVAPDQRDVQRDPAWQQAYRTHRPVVERKISHFTRRPWGGRKARCRGRTRILTDILTRASAINLARLATLGLHHASHRLGHRLTPPPTSYPRDNFRCRQGSKFECRRHQPTKRHYISSVHPARHPAVFSLTGRSNSPRRGQF